MKKKDEFDNFINENTNFEGDFSKVKKEIKLEPKTYKKQKRIAPLVLSLSSAFLVLAIAGTVTYSVLNQNNNATNKDTEDKDNGNKDTEDKGDKKDQGELVEAYKPQPYTKKYSLNDKKIMEDESLKMLNSISYPSSRGSESINEDFVSAITNFSQNLFESAINNNFNDFTLSPLSLYYEMNNISLISSSTKLNDEVDAVLGYNKENRISELKKVFKNNFYVAENATTQIYNSIFFNNDYALNEEYIKKLSDAFVEAYSMNFTMENLPKILEWINTRLDSESTISDKDLEFSDDTMMYLFSLLYFKNKWLYSVNDTSNFEDYFIGTGGAKNVTYMRHSYGSVLEETVDYYSFFDHYENGYKIKYIISKSSNTPTLEAIGNADIVAINKDNYKKAIIDLSFPKFSKTSNVSVKDILADMGVKAMFNENENNFPDIYTNCPNNLYISFIKQYNQVDFNETGTLVKTVTYAGGDKGDTGEPSYPYYNIKLNRPFIYVIYDNNNIPLYVGNVTNI